MKKGMMIGMGAAFMMASACGYMLYKNMDHDTKRGVKKAANRKMKKMENSLNEMM